MNWETNKSSFKSKLMDHKHEDLIDYEPTTLEIILMGILILLLVITFLGN